MSMFDAFRYDGKRVLVVGGATGMGAAAARAGAGRRRRGGGHGLRRGEAPGRQGHPRQPGRQGLHRPGGRRVRRAGARADSPAPAWPTGRPTSRRSTSSATAT